MSVCKHLVVKLVVSLALLKCKIYFKSYYLFLSKFEEIGSHVM
jgi:hypothetical protein